MELTAAAGRVLGALVEKERTTPQGYPLTDNALLAACNQTTSRDPVVSYDVATVRMAVRELRELGLLRTVHRTGERSDKHRHELEQALGLSPAQAALLAVLLLRGPQTLAELRARTERMHAVRLARRRSTGELLAMAERDEPLVALLPRQPGRKEARFGQLLAAAAGRRRRRRRWRPRGRPHRAGPDALATVVERAQEPGVLGRRAQRGWPTARSAAASRTRWRRCAGRSTSCAPRWSGRPAAEPALVPTGHTRGQGAAPTTGGAPVTQTLEPPHRPATTPHRPGAAVARPTSRPRSRPATSTAAAAMFAPTSFWRDLVSFSWNLTTVEGRDGVRELLEGTLADDRRRAASPSPSRRPRRTASPRRGSPSRRPSDEAAACCG